VYHSTTFGPWKRALAKVDKEETFHLRHGQQWIKRLAPDPAERATLQRAVDWMFMLTLEWFGLPDTEKRHTEQLDYGFKGRSNDELRQAWMTKVVPFCEEVGLNVPAHREGDRYLIDAPFPARFVASEKRWRYEDGQIGWDEVLKRWKGRGPMNREYVGSLQRGWTAA
jgi:ring-1,2-phenylacetyl-CoA epoxidase subunit PaaA